MPDILENRIRFVLNSLAWVGIFGLSLSVLWWG